MAYAFGCAGPSHRQDSEAATTSRALAVQVRPLELYNQVRLCRCWRVYGGRKIIAVTLWVKRRTIDTGTCFAQFHRWLRTIETVV